MQLEKEIERKGASNSFASFENAARRISIMRKAAAESALLY